MRGSNILENRKNCKQQNQQDHKTTPGSNLKNVINPFYSSFQSKDKNNNKNNGCILHFLVGIENMNYIDTIYERGISAKYKLQPPPFHRQQYQIELLFCWRPSNAVVALTPHSKPYMIMESKGLNFSIHCRHALRSCINYNFAKSPPYFGLQYIQSKVMGSFLKISWPSQNV